MRDSRHRPRDSHSYGRASAKLPLDLFHAFLDRSYGRLIDAARGRYSVSVQFAPVAFERHKLNLCAAQIHPNPKLIGVWHAEKLILAVPLFFSRSRTRPTMVGAPTAERSRPGVSRATTEKHEAGRSAPQPGASPASEPYPIRGARRSRGLLPGQSERAHLPYPALFRYFFASSSANEASEYQKSIVRNREQPPGPGQTRPPPPPQGRSAALRSIQRRASPSVQSTRIPPGVGLHSRDPPRFVRARIAAFLREAVPPCTPESPANPVPPIGDFPATPSGKAAHRAPRRSSPPNPLPL